MKLDTHVLELLVLAAKLAFELVNPVRQLFVHRLVITFLNGLVLFVLVHYVVVSFLPVFRGRTDLNVELHHL